MGRVLLTAGLCAVPLSIALTEALLGLALAFRIAALARGRVSLSVPRALWCWAAWAALEILAWVQSPDKAAGTGEMRHLILLFALFLVLPAISEARHAVSVWRGLFVTSAAGSAALIADFIVKRVRYRGEIAAAGDPSAYLRTGGLLHNWMVYGTVEVFLFAALLEFRCCHPEERKWVAPLAAINVAAIVVSLTRMLWVACLVVLAAHLLWRHSKWIWAVPVLPAVLFLGAPEYIRARFSDFLRPDYYSNQERLQMCRVGWEMIRGHPLAGIGPGRVNGVYTQYLSPGDPVPAFHGHLHNNALQVAAEFGLPVAAAAVVFALVLLLDLSALCRRAKDPDTQFLCRTAVLCVVGFLVEGMFDYTYGHSLGLILLSFAVLWPILRLPAPGGSFPRP